MTKTEFIQIRNKCSEQFDPKSLMEAAIEDIRFASHDNVVDQIIDDLNLEYWDGELAGASQRVRNMYNDLMDDFIDEEMDNVLEQQMKEHISQYFDDSLTAVYSEEIDGLTQALWLEIKRTRVEVMHADLEIIGLMYSDTIPGFPFSYHESRYQSDEKYRHFIHDNYIRIVTIRERLLKQYQVDSISLIPNARKMIREEWYLI